MFDLKTKIITFLLIAFLISLTTGISLIQAIQTDFSKYMIIIFLAFLFGSMIYINISFTKRGMLIYLYPLIAFVMYLPLNFLAGIILPLKGGLTYYASFPRYWAILYYGFFLVMLYLIAKGIDELTKYKVSKFIYGAADTISFIVYPILLAYTYFVFLA